MIQDSRIKEPGIFEKLVRDRSGRLFRMRFFVVERDGILRGKVISCEQIPALQTNRVRRFHSPFVKGLPVRSAQTGSIRRGGGGFYLPVRKSLHAIKDKGLRIEDLYFSPYFNKFDFLTVIKIRAPALRVI